MRRDNERRKCDYCRSVIQPLNSKSGNTKGGSITVPLTSYLTENYNFCFYLQNRLIQTSQTGGQWYSETSPLVFPGESSSLKVSFTRSSILYQIKMTSQKFNSLMQNLPCKWVFNLTPDIKFKIFFLLFYCFMINLARQISETEFIVSPAPSGTWGLYYKTFYGRNLRIFVIS